jgi:hypothetical protein
MATLEVKKEAQGMTASECYQACLSRIEGAGYKIFKKRDLANLIICNETIDGKRIDLSLMIPFGSPTSVSLSLSSDAMDEKTLEGEAARILDVLLPA